MAQTTSSTTREEDFTRVNDAIRRDARLHLQPLACRKTMCVEAPPAGWSSSARHPAGHSSACSPASSRRSSSRRSSVRRLTVFMARAGQADLALLGDLMAKGTLTPVIDRREELSAVPQAIHDVATRHARGKVVVVV